jgi:single-stranded-DNA-specific exonuclease
MPGLDHAAARLLSALREHHPIAIYGDYDVDGVCATSILFHMLRALDPASDIRTYVPHRLEEGYGLNTDALLQLARAGARVIISVDCGITAHEPARALHDAFPDCDLIITDHHNLPAAGEPLPHAHALVHPRLPRNAQPGEAVSSPIWPSGNLKFDHLPPPYPFGDLCGAGVAYKLAWRLATLASGTDRLPMPLKKLLIDLLAPAAMGVVADVVPMLGENRVIAKFGLRRIKHSTLPGLRELVEASGLAGEDVVEEDVGFKLGPRLNACGRMGHAREAVELFTVAPPARGAEIAAELTRKNDERRAVERRIFTQACELAEASGMTGPDRRGIVLAHEDWHPGVVGIVCSRLVEKYHRPALLLQRAAADSPHAGTCHGSGRSVEGFSLHAALVRCAPLLATFGGHDMAAGLKLSSDNLDTFTAAFIEVCNELIRPEDLHPVEKYDTAATLDELTIESVGTLRDLAPFGPGNPEPRLLLRGLTSLEPPRLMGKDDKHFSVRVGQDGRIMRFVAWSMANLAEHLGARTRFDAIVKPRLNEWNNSRTVECEIVDFRIAESA